MAANTVVRARIDESIKVEAGAVLEATGLMVSDAFRMLLTSVAAEKTLPAELLSPNVATIAAIRDSRAGKVAKFASAKAAIAALHEDD